MKESYFFDKLARTVARHPSVMLVVLVAASIALALQLRHLEADPSPRALLASADPGTQKLEAAARAHFGSTDNVVVAIVSSDDAISEKTLGYTHRVGRAFAQLPHVERVDSLTRLSWPKHKAVAEELTFEDLEAQEPTTQSPELMGAAADLVAATPDVFPGGLDSLAERGAGTTIEPLVSGDDVSSGDVTLAKEILQKTRQLDGRLVSRDKKHLVVAVQFSDALVKHDEMAGVVTSIEAWLAKNPPPEGTHVTLSGLPVIRTSLVRHMRSDQRVLIPATLLASFVVLALSFRWWPAMVLPLLAVGVTALWLLSGMALFGEPLNVLNNMLPALVIIIGLNEAVHIIGRYTEECRNDSDKVRALAETVRSMGAACLTTTATSAVGLLALVVSRTEMLRRFGIVGAIGLFLAYGVTLLIVPAALSLLHAPPGPDDPTEEQRGRIEKVLSRVTTAALRRPWWVLSLAVLSMVAAALSAQRIVVDSTLLDQFSKSDPVYEAVHLLETEFEGVRPLEVTLTSTRDGRMFEPEVLRALHGVTSWAGKQPGVLRASDATEPLSGGWAALSGRPLEVEDALRSPQQIKALTEILSARDKQILGPLLTKDGQRARMRIKLADIGSHGTGVMVERVRDKLRQAMKPYADIMVSFGGDAYVSSRGLDAVVADLSGSVLAAAVVIFLLLAVLLRDFKLALLAIPANLLPQLWTMGWMVVRGIPLNASSAIIFSLSIGLAVDGSIHLVSRFQEERARGVLTTVALVRAVRGSGRNIVVSSLALILGFSAMLLSNFVPVQRFAELITVSMLGSAFATLVIQPVLLRVFLAHKSEQLPLPSG